MANLKEIFSNAINAINECLNEVKADTAKQEDIIRQATDKIVENTEVLENLVSDMADFKNDLAEIVADNSCDTEGTFDMCDNLYEALGLTDEDDEALADEQADEELENSEDDGIVYYEK